ncbi:MAG TPA: 4-hydroxythreonine-4-phosphate dehydrogenase PdxA [Xenococcaceae cyanobacterium]|jgi:4-hydroxythreonine-4-phosphate dehydrogenase
MNHHLAITIGDPAGIGTEVVLKALANVSRLENCQLKVIGSRAILDFTYQQLLQQGVASNSLADPDTLDLIDLPYDYPLTFGTGDKNTGKASFHYLEKAIALTLAGKFQGIVTAPIAKALWQQAGYNYPGQTEVLAQAANTARYGMLFVARSPHTDWVLRTLLATTHIPLCQVSQSLTPELLSLKLDLLINCLEADFGIIKPKIVISGLNPHSGEAGQLGTEEQDWLLPWFKTVQQKYPSAQLIGLVPPDTMWVKPGQAWYSDRHHGADAYLALYHDQGLIPVKLMAFDRAINTTIGLPWIRTSPDHGTAFDIAGKGIADARSMEAAIALAVQIAQHRIRLIN